MRPESVSSLHKSSDRNGIESWSGRWSFLPDKRGFQSPFRCYNQPVNLADAEQFLLSLQPGKIDLDLGRLRRVLSGLGLIPPPFPVVLVGGTNGKGSAIIFAEALLRSQLRVGAFIKPHVYRITERVRIDGQPLSDGAFAEATGRLKKHLDGSDAKVTFFEATLIVALLAMQAESVELALIEVGLGGRFDAANALPRVLTAITSISRDHEQYLGSDLAGIAVEKAGIMAEGVPVVLSRGIRSGEPDCREILRKLAALKRAPVIEPEVELKRLGGGLRPVHQDFAVEGSLRKLDLPRQVSVNQLGLYQSHNLEVSLSLASRLAELGHIEPPLAVPSTINTTMPARFEVNRTGAGWIVLDAAHNVEGMRMLAEALQEYFPGASPTLVFGCQQGKDVPRMLAPLKGRVKRVVAIELPILHPMPLGEVQDGVREAGLELRLSGQAFSHQMSRLLGEVKSGGIVVVAGSIYYLGSVAEALGLGSASHPGLNQ